MRYRNHLTGSASWRALMLGGLAGLFLSAGLGTAHAGATMTFGGDNNESLSVGLGLRASYDNLQYAAPNGKSGSNDFSLDSVRLYINGSLNEWIKATLNTERDSNGTINVLDGYARFEPKPYVNLWIGRMLPPSDRSNLDGPYYLSSWLFPLVSQYPSKFDGRDDGATVWGKWNENKFVYSAGAYNGHNRVEYGSNNSDNLLYAGRVVYNFLDAEDNPAYYESSTYYGKADILTLGAAVQYQKDGVGTATKKGDYTAFNIDALFEKKILDGGAFTLEGAYYHYDTGGGIDVTPTISTPGTANVGGITQGNAYLVSTAVLLPQKVWKGQFQPVVRFQDFDATLTKVTTRQYDCGVNYIIDGHNARISAVYAYTTTSHVHDVHEFVIGTQLQF